MEQLLLRAHAQIKSLAPYQAGQTKQSLNNIKPDNIIKLASNENPLGASPSTRQAIIDEVNDIYLYPEHMAETTSLLAKHLNVTEGQCILGCGSESIISMIMQVFNKADQHFLIPQYGFFAYRINAQSHNANARIIPTDNYKLDIERIISMVTPETAAIFIDNPANPLGSYLTKYEIKFLLDNLPKSTLLVLDEAYYEYASVIDDYPNSLELLNKHPNLIILRTFSKAYGLAGMRVGYGIAHSDIISLLNRVKFPFNLSSLSLAAARSSLQDQDFVQKSIADNTAGLNKYIDFFKQNNIDYLPSVANFITIDLKRNVKDFFNYMLKQGIILRPLTPYNLTNHIRITIGTEKQNQCVIDAIKTYLGEKL